MAPKNLYFNGYTEETGHELYRLEAGSNTPMLINVNQDWEGSGPYDFSTISEDGQAELNSPFNTLVDTLVDTAKKAAPTFASIPTLADYLVNGSPPQWDHN